MGFLTVKQSNRQTAIDLVKKNRDAELSVYQDLLTSFNDWNWGTNFTPGSTSTLAQDNNYWNAPGGKKPITEPKVGDYAGGEYYEGNGVWITHRERNNRNGRNSYDYDG